MAMPPAKQSKTSPPSQTILPPMDGKFSIGGCTCEIYRIHGPGEGPINTQTMLARATIIGASMRL
ncbi:MAG: hypothetical protein G01um101413_29 [Parcubacteria group bacterium Gr01-1014_13]|nr:MAG: hypothetical protein G01um101413_29 [Parcubacteria group bacterium Gr01-1014_13]